MSDHNIVEARGLTKIYRRGAAEIRPLDGLDLDVSSGEFLAVMGPSGSGKSTLLHIIGGLDHPDQGTCRVGDREVTKMSESQLCAFRASSVGFIFQVFNLVPVLTAQENVELPLRLLAVSRARRKTQVATALRIVGLEDRADHLPGQLSGGQEQRVAIARALVTDPEIIIADEPTGDLDQETGGQIVSILASLAADHGKTVIMVTHDPVLARRGNRIIYLHQGRMVDHDPRQTLQPEGEKS
jgi:putative ABC transport system ATP-binding protein